MDGSRFDDALRSFARSGSRRGFLAGLGALAAGLAGRSAVAQAQCGNVICYNRATRTVDQACNPGCVCCVYANGNSRCTAPGGCTGTVVAPATTTAAPTTPAPTTTTAAPTTTTTTTAAPTTTTTTTLAPGTCPAGSTFCSLGLPGQNVDFDCCGAGSLCQCVEASGFCSCCPTTSGTCINCADGQFACCSSGGVCTCCAGGQTCSNGVCS